MVHIITQFFKVNYNSLKDLTLSPIDLIKKRQAEITHCFKKNFLHKDVEKIHFLYEKEEDVVFLEKEGININHEKIVLHKLGCRMNYSLIFNYANKYLKNKICVYLHADMCINSGFNLLNSENIKNKVFALTSHNPNTCNKKFICECTRKFNTSKGLYGVTFDGFVFKSPMKEEVVKEADHCVQRLGGETRLICILKEYGYKVICPNRILRCEHHHNIKIFDVFTKKDWITRSGESKPQKYYCDIFKKQKSLNFNWDKRIVGGGIPFFMGSCKFVDNL